MRVMDRKLLVSDAVVSAELDDEAVLLNVETGVYFGLDAIGTRIWELLKRGASEDEIVQLLLDEYDVELSELQPDVARFLDLLVEKGLIQSQGG